MQKTLILLVALLLVSFSPVYSQHPEPPKQLAKLFAAVVEIEDAVDDGDWKQARKSVAQIEKALMTIGPSVRKTAGDNTYQALGSAVAHLKKELEAKNKSSLSPVLLDLQKVVFHTMAFYRYHVHPAFTVIQEYVDEAVEAAQEKNFSRVVHEMKEVANIVTVTTKIMMAKGIGKGMQTDLRSYLVAVVAAAEAKDQERALQSLQKMEVLTGAFVWMGAQQ